MNNAVRHIPFDSRLVRLWISESLAFDICSMFCVGHPYKVQHGVPQFQSTFSIVISFTWLYCMYGVGFDAYAFAMESRRMWYTKLFRALSQQMPFKQQLLENIWECTTSNYLVTDDVHNVVCVCWTSERGHFLICSSVKMVHLKYLLKSHGNASTLFHSRYLMLYHKDYSSRTTNSKSRYSGREKEKLITYNSSEMMNLKFPFPNEK